MVTLSLAAARLLQFHEAENAPAFAVKLIGTKPILSLAALDQAYSELISLGLLRVTSATIELPEEPGRQRFLYTPI